MIACDSVEALSQTNAKRIAVQGNVVLDGLSGVRNVQGAEGNLTFLYGGEMKQLLQRLSEGEVTDLSVSEPDLEEIFMHYYEKGDN